MGYSGDCPMSLACATPGEALSSGKTFAGHLLPGAATRKEYGGEIAFTSWYLRQISDALVDRGSEKIADFALPGDRLTGRYHSWCNFEGSKGGIRTLAGTSMSALA